MSMKLAFFDVDGTLSVPRYFIDGRFQIGTDDRGWIEYCEEHREDSYEFCFGSKPVRAYAEKRKEEGCRLFVLSSIASDLEMDAKTKFVKRVYPGLFEDFFYVRKDLDKLDVIREMAEKNGVELEECELVEDTLAILFPANRLGIRATHISMLTSEENDAEANEYNQ